MLLTVKHQPRPLITELVPVKSPSRSSVVPVAAAELDRPAMYNVLAPVIAPATSSTSLPVMAPDRCSEDSPVMAALELTPNTVNAPALAVIEPAAHSDAVVSAAVIVALVCIPAIVKTPLFAVTLPVNVSESMTSAWYDLNQRVLGTAKGE